MGGRAFRGRWVVRWLFALGGVSLAAAVLLLVAALGSTPTAGPSDADLRRSEELCQARLNAGDDPGSGACATLAGSTIDRRTELGAAAAVLAVLGITQLVGALRVGVTMTGPGVIVRNPLRTHRLLWSDIAGFRVDRGAGGRTGYAVGRVDLVDGTSRRIEAVCAMPWEPRTGFADERVIAELNEHLAAHRGAATPPPAAPTEEQGEEPAPAGR